MRYIKFVENINRVFFLFLFAFLIGFVCAEDNVTIEFNVEGCSFMYKGTQVDVAPGECSDGDAYGEFFCGENLYDYVTREEGLGCSMGLDILEGLGCCPEGMFCNKTSTGLFMCVDRYNNCFEQDNKDDCNDVGCIWMDVVKKCTSNPKKDYGCSYYNNSGTCETDKWKLGVSGVGTELCGTSIKCDGEIFSIDKDSCRCEWDSVISKCKFVLSAESFHNYNNKKFSCSNVYELGECVDGKQDVKWDSKSNVESGDGNVSPSCLAALGCNGGEATRFCGESIIKLPGISLIGLLLSLFFVGIYYFNISKV